MCFLDNLSHLAFKAQMTTNLAAIKHFSSKTPIKHFVNSLCIGGNTSGEKKAAQRIYNSSAAAWGNEVRKYLYIQL